MSAFNASWNEVMTYIDSFVDSARSTQPERETLAAKLYEIAPDIMNIDVRRYVCCFTGNRVYNGYDVKQAIQLMLCSAIPGYVKYGDIWRDDNQEDHRDTEEDGQNYCEEEKEDRQLTREPSRLFRSRNDDYIPKYIYVPLRRLLH